MHTLTTHHRHARDLQNVPYSQFHRQASFVDMGTSWSNIQRFKVKFQVVAMLEFGYAQVSHHQAVGDARTAHAILFRGQAQMPQASIPSTVGLAMRQDGQFETNIVFIVWKVVHHPMILHERGTVHAGPLKEARVLSQEGNFGRSNGIKRNDIEDGNLRHINGQSGRHGVLFLDRHGLLSSTHFPHAMRTDTD